MHELYELKDKLMDLLEEQSKKGITSSNLDVVDKLTHTIKNLCKIIEDSEGYSERGRSYARMGTDGTRRGMDYSRYGMSYADRRRDSMGRYVADDGIISELHRLKDETSDQKARTELDRLIRKMETM